MNFWKNFKKWFSISCICFTLITMLMLLIALLGSRDEKVIHAAQVLRTFPCALCLGAAWAILQAKKPARYIRILSHYLIHVLAIFLFLYLPVSLSGQAAARFLMFVLLSAIYWIVFGLCALIRSRIRLLTEQDHK